MAGKRILINALSLGLGGSRSYIVNLLRELRRDDRGFAFTVLALKGQLDGLDASGVRLKEVSLPVASGPLRTPLRVVYEQTLLPLEARRHDLLYCVGDICPLLGQTPIVVLLRNLNIYDRTWDDTPRTRMLFQLSKAGVRRARFAVFPTQAAANRIRKAVPIPSDRVRVVHYGIDVDAFRLEAKPPPDAPPYVFLPANPERHKNIATLIRALPLLNDRELEVWIAGRSTLQPEHRVELEGLASQLGVGSRVRFLGLVPYGDLVSYYRGAQALVLPSYHETFGHPILEAMISGTPIVASDIPTFRELAEGVALFFPPDDEVRLAECVDQLEAEPEAMKHRVKLGQERATEFTWKRSIDELCRVFERALEVRP